MVYFLIWLRHGLSSELSMHRMLWNERLLTSIIIWPCWKALAHPYAGVSMATVSQWRGFGFLFSADVLCLCLLRLLIVLHQVSVPVCECTSFWDRDRQTATQWERLYLSHTHWHIHTHTYVYCIRSPSVELCATNRSVAPFTPALFQLLLGARAWKAPLFPVHTAAAARHSSGTRFTSSSKKLSV